jgi:F-type H+-transporting ATPase subunit delta
LHNSSAKLIARRYTKALFDLAAKANALDAVAKDLGAFRDSLNESEALQSFVRNPVISRKGSEKAVEALLGKMKANALTLQFFALLARHRRLEVISDICETFFAMLAEYRGEVVAEATFAASPSTEQVARLSAALKKATGREVNLKTYENQALLGGLVLKVGGKMIDRSLKATLDRMETTLKRAPLHI